MVPDDVVILFLCGDVMLGRGVDQILPHPGDSALRETYVADAREYVHLAEAVNGPIPIPVDYVWPWGDALQALQAAAPDVRVVNLETTITRSSEFAPWKSVHYRMDPGNIPCLSILRPDVCALANNHVLDFGRDGLGETLYALAGAGLTAAGAGRDLREARRPGIVSLAEGGRVLVFSFGMESSGIPATWAAAEELSGIDFVAAPSAAGAADVIGRVREVKRPGDVVVASIHWGSNWGYRVSRAQRDFAHELIDGGVDVVHGHSSHHPRPIEVYRDKLVLYGCGDFIDDYEGISGYEEFRDDLRLLYFASVARATGALASLRMVPMQARQLRLRHASSPDAAWLCEALNRISAPYRSHVDLETDGGLALRRN